MAICGNVLPPPLFLPVSGLQTALNYITPGPRPILPHACIDPESLADDRASGKKHGGHQLAASAKARSWGRLGCGESRPVGRDLCHRDNIVHELTERGIVLKILNEQGVANDASIASGKSAFGIFRGPRRARTRIDLRKHPRQMASARDLDGTADARTK